jgi:hypothetical protein
MFNTKHNNDIKLALDKAMLEANSKQPSRDYLGASRWGEECERKLGYEFHKTPKDSGGGFSADVLRIFDMGHDSEARMAAYMVSAGYDLKTHGADGKQIGFTAAGGKLGGHCDGIIHSGPGLVDVPVVWENKALNNKSWNDTLEKGVKVSKPVYYAQIQTYIGYFDLKGGLFTAVNRDTGDIYAELVSFDPMTAQEVTDRAVRVIESSNPEELPRITKVRTDWRCRFCSFRNGCWSEKTSAPTEPKARLFNGKRIR